MIVHIIKKVESKFFLNVKPIECIYDGCQYRFAIMSDLQDHINKRHTFQNCEDCGQTFATRSGRSSHKRVHTDERKFHCNSCPNSFTRSSVLRNNIRVHSLRKHVKNHKSNQSEGLSNDYWSVINSSWEHNTFQSTIHDHFFTTIGSKTIFHYRKFWIILMRIWYHYYFSLHLYPSLSICYFDYQVLLHKNKILDYFRIIINMWTLNLLF